MKIRTDDDFIMENTFNNDLISIIASSENKQRVNSAVKQLRKNVAELERRDNAFCALVHVVCDLELSEVVSDELGDQYPELKVEIEY